MINAGFGTMLVALFGFNQISKAQLAIGIMQFASAWIIIGYIWSAVWGLMILIKGHPKEKLLDKGNEPQGTNDLNDNDKAPT